MDERKPFRSCIGCRSVKDKKELLRYVISPDGEVILDYNTKLPGRGCYICPDHICLSKAVKQRAFQKALKSNIDVQVEVDVLVKAILVKAQGKISSFISFAIKSKQAVLGTEAAEGDLKKGKISLLLLRSNLSADVKVKWMSRLQRECLPCKVIDEFQALEGIIGHRKVVGIKDKRLAGEIVKEIKRTEQISV